MSNMIPRPPMPNMPQRPQPTLRDTTALICVCGNNTFAEKIHVRLLSKLVTGEAKDTIIPMPLLFCTKCDAPLAEMVPLEIKDELVPKSIIQK